MATWTDVNRSADAVLTKINQSSSTWTDLTSPTISGGGGAIGLLLALTRAGTIFNTNWTTLNKD